MVKVREAIIFKLLSPRGVLCELATRYIILVFIVELHPDQFCRRTGAIAAVISGEYRRA